MGQTDAGGCVSLVISVLRMNPALKVFGYNKSGMKTNMGDEASAGNLECKTGITQIIHNNQVGVTTIHVRAAGGNEILQPLAETLFTPTIRNSNRGR